MPFRPSPPFPSFGQAALLVIGSLMLQVAAGGIVGVVWLAAGSPGTVFEALYNPWALSAINVAATGAALTFGRRATGESFARFYALRAFPASLLPAMTLTALGLAVVMNEVDNLIMEIARLLPGPGADNSLMNILTGDAAGAFCLLIIVAPFTEEYLFRGLILRGLLRHHRSVTAVLLTAVLFGLMHANLRQLPLALVIGAVFGWWAVRTRSVAPGIIGHALFNSVAYAVSQFPEQFATWGFGGEGEHQAWWLTLGSAGVAALGCWWFQQRAMAVILPAPEEIPPAAEAEPPLLDSSDTPRPAGSPP